MNVHIAAGQSQYSPAKMPKTKEAIAIVVATVMTENIIGKKSSNRHGRVALQHTSRIEDGLQKTPIESHTLKLDGTQEKGMQTVATRWKNGSHSRRIITTCVLCAVYPKNLLKTTYNLFQKAAATTYKIFSHSVEIVTVGSGLSFNIYENPELLKEIK